MSLKRQHRVIAQHAAAIVLNPNQPPPGVFRINANLCRPCIQRIFKQLFKNVSGPLYHLSGRDFIRDSIGQDSYAAHLPVEL